MYAIVIEFQQANKNEGLKEVHWLAVYSFFEYLLPDTFICVLKPYNNNDAQAKVYFKEKISIPNGTNQIEIDNQLAVIVDSQESDDLAATRTRVLRFPREPVRLAEASVELRSWFKARVNCLSEPTGCAVSVAACHEEVLEAALGKLSQLEVPSSQSSGGEVTMESGSSAGPKRSGIDVAAASPRQSQPSSQPQPPPQPQPQPQPPKAAARDRKPLFPAAFTSPPQQPQPPPPQQPQPPRQSSQPAGQQQERTFHLGPSCRLIVCCGDLTAVAGVDLVVATTNGALSLRRGLVNALATRLDGGGVRAGETDCQRHLRALPHGSADFGATFLLPRGCAGAFGRLLLLSLTNDRRLADRLGRGKAFRRCMDSCLAQLAARLARLADERRAAGVAAPYLVAMPTVGSTLPLWGRPDEWADALAGALAGLDGQAGALGELRVCCVSPEAVGLLGDAVARQLRSAPEPSAPAASAPADAAAAAASAAAGMNESGDDDDQSDYEDDDDGSSATDNDAVAASESMSIDDDVTGGEPKHQSTSGPPAAAPTCVLCAEDFSAENPATPFHCDSSGSQICRSCVSRLNGSGSSSDSPSSGKCVLCFQRYRPAVGCQPVKGAKMSVDKEAGSLPGFEGTGTLVVKYEFAPGTQEGQQYRGTTRTAYFPDSADGQLIVKRLRAAFAGRVVFNVGASATTGRSNAITWNTLHHKTSKTGGPSRHGYPDPGYLRRISNELSDLGY